MANLSGLQKVAIVLSALEPEIAAELIKEFSDEQIAAITLEMNRFERIDTGLVDMVFEDLRMEMKESKGIIEYDNDNFRKLLEKAIGAEKSEEIIANVEEGSVFPTPFAQLKDISDDDFMRILAGEHSQTIALVLSYTDPDRAAKILSRLPTEFQAEIVMRIATIEPPPVSLLMKVNEVIMTKIKTESRRRKTPAKKKHKFASEILGNLEGAADRDVIEQISHRNPELAEEIKKLMFTFEDIVFVEDEAFRKVLTEIDNSVIALALKTASDEIQDKFFKNMSKRVGDTIREEKELLGPRLLSEVQGAQQQIVDAIKRMEAKGEQVVKKRGQAKEDKFV